jgi:hypothetical protein
VCPNGKETLLKKLRNVAEAEKVSKEIEEYSKNIRDAFSECEVCWLRNIQSILFNLILHSIFRGKFFFKLKETPVISALYVNFL